MSESIKKELTAEGIAVPFTACTDKSFPNFYTEIVAQTDCGGDQVRIGVAANLLCIYLWRNDQMSIVSMKNLLDNMVPAMFEALDKEAAP